MLHARLPAMSLPTIRSRGIAGLFAALALGLVVPPARSHAADKTFAAVLDQLRGSRIERQKVRLSDDPAEIIIRKAPTQVQRAIAASPDGGAAKRALNDMIFARILPIAQLEGMVVNPLVAPYIVGTLIDLQKVQRIPGADETLRRMAQGNAVSNLTGASFEIKVGARFHEMGRLVRLSTMVNGHEVDFTLKGPHAIGEAKWAHGDMTGPIKKALEQLDLRRDGGAEVLVLGGTPSAANLERVRRHASGHKEIATYLYQLGSDNVMKELLALNVPGRSLEKRPTLRTALRTVPQRRVSQQVGVDRSPLGGLLRAKPASLTAPTRPASARYDRTASLADRIASLNP